MIGQFQFWRAQLVSDFPWEVWVKDTPGRGISVNTQNNDNNEDVAASPLHTPIQTI